MKLSKILLASSLMLALFVSPVYAETSSSVGILGEIDPVSHNVTGKLSEVTGTNGHVDDELLAFDVAWDDTEIELEKTETYGLVWDPNSMSYVQDTGDTTTEYTLKDNKIQISVTNKSIKGIQVTAGYQPVDPMLLQGGFSGGTVSIDGVTLSNGANLNSIGTPVAPAILTGELYFSQTGVNSDLQIGQSLETMIKNNQSLGTIKVEVSATH